MFLQELPDNPNGKDYVSSAMDLNNRPSNNVKDWSRTMKMTNWKPHPCHFTHQELEQMAGGGIEKEGSFDDVMDEYEISPAV